MAPEGIFESILVFSITSRIKTWLITVVVIFCIRTGLRAVLGQYGLFADRNTRDYLAWTIGNGDPMHEVCSKRMKRKQE